MRPAVRRYEEQERHSTSSYQLELGTKSLLSLFFALAIVCGLFFAFGYTLGKHAIPATFSLGASPRPVTAATTTSAAPAGVQPPNPAELGQAETNQTPDTLTTGPAPAVTTTTTAPAAAGTTTPPATAAAPIAPAASTAPPVNSSSGVAPSPTGVYHVQVFAGSQADAQSVASNLLGKGYPAAVAPPAAGEVNLFRVEVGPYLTPDEAQAMRSRLAADGYQAIVKNQ